MAEGTRAGLNIHSWGFCHESSNWRGVYTHFLPHQFMQVYTVLQYSGLPLLQDVRDLQGVPDGD
jgi:hypothetical protein